MLPLMVPKLEILTLGVVAVIPVPLNGADCGDPLASSVTSTLPVLLPMLVGVKVTVMVQVPLATTVAPQVVVLVNMAASVPEIPMLEIFRVALPVLVSRIDCTDGELTVTLPKDRLTGDKVTEGAGGVPLKHVPALNDRTEPFPSAGPPIIVV